MEHVEPSALVVYRSDYSVERKVLSMKAHGYENSEIAELLNTTENRVAGILKRRLSQATDEARLDAIRAAENAKLDEIEEVFYEAAVTPGHEAQIDAAEMVLKTMKHRSDINGLKTTKNINENTHFSLVGILSEIHRAGETPPEPKVINGATGSSDE